MNRINRRMLTVLPFLFLAACGAPASKFRRYDGPPVTQVLVNKSERRMYLMNGATVLKSYDVGLGTEPVGAKQFEGDGKTPEGVYFVDRINPDSAYHLSLGVSYPNTRDRAYACSQGRDPGGDIFIHGWGPEGRRLAPGNRDWTAGCIAVRDDEIEEIYAMVKGGIPIVIKG